jgi:hypothetical protein
VDVDIRVLGRILQSILENEGRARSEFYRDRKDHVDRETMRRPQYLPVKDTMCPGAGNAFSGALKLVFWSEISAHVMQKVLLSHPGLQLG